MPNRLYRTTGTRTTSTWVPDFVPIVVPPPAPTTPKPPTYKPPAKPPEPEITFVPGPGSPTSGPYIPGYDTGLGFGPLRPPF